MLLRQDAIVTLMIQPLRYRGEERLRITEQASLQQPRYLLLLLQQPDTGYGHEVLVV